MPADNATNNDQAKDESDSTKNPAGGSIFNGGKDYAASAERAAQGISDNTPGTGTGDWDEENETVSGSASAYVHKLESGREPWLMRQTAHGALDVMGGFLAPFFQGVQKTADEQLKVSSDPKTTSDMASAAKGTAYQKVKEDGVKIEREDRPTIDKETQDALKKAHYRTEGAFLVCKFGAKAYDVALDPSGHKAYVVTDDGALYGVDRTTGVKRKVITSEALGATRGVAVDTNNKAYVTDFGGKRLLQVDLSTGETQVILKDVTAQGIGLDRNGKAYITDAGTAELFEVDLKKKEKKSIIGELGEQVSGVALVLDENGKAQKAYTGHWWAAGDLFEIDLTAATPTKQPVTKADYSPDVAVDGAGTAYVCDHSADILYKVDLKSRKRREAVKSAAGAFSPFGIALDTDNGVAYVCTYEGQLWRFSLSTLQSPELIEIVTT
ncbi:Vgb family protein [Streptomyces syringium]|uniref:Vgb family protein n=1 Tax=Streptomyces syringium TaxID=76729 RepID=UPI003455940E